MSELTMFPWGSGALWMLGVTLKGILVLLLILIAAAALHRASAGLRHLLWSGGIVAVLLIPLVSLVLPWELPVVPVPVAMTAPVTFNPEAATFSARDTQGHTQGSTPHLTASGSAAAAPVLPDAKVPTWLFALWGAGVLFFLGRLGLGAMLLRRVVRGATPLDSPDWTHPLMEGADRFALARLPRLLMTEGVPMPVVSGVFNPAIVVPANAGEWTDRRRRAVLCHELAHIRRLDLPTNLLSRLACALYWFNPLVWIAARRLRVESERAADDLVLGVGTRPSEYADHLLQIVCGARRGHAPEVAIPMAQRREFEGRMLAILDEGARRDTPSGLYASGMVVLALLLLLPITAMAPATAGIERDGMKQPGPGTVSPPMLAALLGGLEEVQPDRRVGAATALGTLKVEDGVGSLGWHLIRDSDPKVRVTAAWALGEIANPEALDPLIESALRDGDEAVRGMAVWALGQIADPAALDKLDMVLADASADVRIRGAWAIGNTAPSRASGPLVKALQDPDFRVAEMAAWALGQIRDPRTVPDLEAIMGDGDSWTKPGMEALWALVAIGGEAAREPLTRAQSWEILDKKLADAIRLSLAGEPAAPRPNHWPQPEIR